MDNMAYIGSALAALGILSSVVELGTIPQQAAERAAGIRVEQAQAWERSQNEQEGVLTEAAELNLARRGVCRADRAAVSSGRVCRPRVLLARERCDGVVMYVRNSSLRRLLRVVEGDLASMEPLLVESHNVGASIALRAIPAIPRATLRLNVIETRRQVRVLGRFDLWADDLVPLWASHPGEGESMGPGMFMRVGADRSVTWADTALEAEGGRILRKAAGELCDEWLGAWSNQSKQEVNDGLRLALELPEHVLVQIVADPRDGSIVEELRRAGLDRYDPAVISCTVLLGLGLHARIAFDVPQSVLPLLSQRGDGVRRRFLGDGRTMPVPLATALQGT